MIRQIFTLIHRKQFIIFLLFFQGLTAVAQEGPSKDYTLQVLNNKKEPVPFSTISVINRDDRSQSFTKVADSIGRAIFRLSKGQWMVNITSTNYHHIEKGMLITGSQSIFTFTAEPLPKTLGGVTVTSQKPLIRQEDDKTIIDPESLASSSTSGYEVLEKTPGLFVDQDGNIYINSLTPAQVYINGREMKMGASDMATMLKSLPPNSISLIEILRTPSAKYDASGTGGIVNVVLKKGVKIGLTGSVNFGWQQGEYANEFGGISLNNNNGKITSYLNLNYSRRNNLERIETNRIFAPDSVLSQDAATLYPTRVYFAGYGIGYELNKKWELSFDGRFSRNGFDNRTSNESQILVNNNQQTITHNLNTSKNDGFTLNWNNGISSKYKIDSLGSEWTNDLAFTFTQNKADQFYSTQYYEPLVPVNGGGGNGNNKRNFFTGQSDLKWKFAHQFTFETGIKSSVLDFKSVTNYYRDEVGIREKDLARTNTFHYRENINAVYLQGTKTIAGIVIKVGTRMENTNMKGMQIIPYDTSFNIHRTDLFPYVYISRKLMRIAGYDLRAYLIYRRTITRPVYEQLNPFPRFVDQYLSEVGNPALRPQFTKNYEANISVDERPILAIGVNQTQDIFTNVIYQSDTSRSQAFRTYDNLGNNKEFYLRGLGALPPGKKYFFVLGAQYNHNFYQGLYENKPLSFKKGTWTFFTYHSLKLDKRSQITLNGFIRLRGQQQFYELSTFGALNTSINRQFLNQKLTVTVGTNDIFASNRNEFTIDQGSIIANGSRSSDTRRFTLSIRYNFGIRKKEDNNIFTEESPERSN